MQLLWLFELDGVVAQLVERLVRNEKVRGSTPLGSTIPNFVKNIGRVARVEWFQPRKMPVFLKETVKV